MFTAIAPILACGRRTALALLCGLVSAAQAQTPDLPPLRLLSLSSIDDALLRLPGTPTPAPRTSGTLALRGKQLHVAEYLVLVDVAGELPAKGRDGRLLGTPVGDGPALLAYTARPDIAALQAMVDFAWADLQARLDSARVVLADAAQAVRQHGAVYPASSAASTPDAPVYLTHSLAGSTRRYLVLAPSGMALVPRTATGIGAGDAAVRVAWAAQGVEGVSLVMALHLSTLDATGTRQAAFVAPGGLPTLSPLMELAPAPAAALVQAHGQQALVNLAEALVPAGHFGRLRLAPMDGPIPSNDPLKPLLSFGQRLSGDAAPRRVTALLDLDGPATGRLAVYLTSAANQAIADALKAGH